MSEGERKVISNLLIYRQFFIEMNCVYPESSKMFFFCFQDKENLEFNPELTIDTISQPNSVWHYFGFIRRSGTIIDKTHKYCNECLKKEKIFR